MAAELERMKELVEKLNRASRAYYQAVSYTHLTLPTMATV